MPNSTPNVQVSDPFGSPQSLNSEPFVRKLDSARHAHRLFFNLLASPQRLP